MTTMKNRRSNDEITEFKRPQRTEIAIYKKIKNKVIENRVSYKLL